MYKLNLGHPEHFPEVDLTIYRRAIKPKLAGQIVQAGLKALNESAEFDDRRLATRGFVALEAVTLDVLPVFRGVVDQNFAGRFSTVKLNLQGPRGKQGWHQDYVLEPYVLYPQGEGELVFAPKVKTLEEARALVSSSGTISVPIHEGDVAALHQGGTIFHRGMNLSETESRLTAVLH